MKIAYKYDVGVINQGSLSFL